MRFFHRVFAFVCLVTVPGLFAACSPDQCGTIYDTPVVGEGLRVLQRLIDGYVMVQGVGAAALCSNGTGSGPGSQPEATHLQSCTDCLEKSCTPQLDACEKDTTCDCLANNRQDCDAANAVWDAAAACVRQCTNPCTVSTSSTSSTSSSSGAGQDAGAP